MSLNECAIQQLKAILSTLKAKTSGNKDDLINRLGGFDPKEVDQAIAYVFDKAIDGEIKSSYLGHRSLQADEGDTRGDLRHDNGENYNGGMQQQQQIRCSGVDNSEGVPNQIEKLQSEVTDLKKMFESFMRKTMDNESLRTVVNNPISPMNEFGTSRMGINGIESTDGSNINRRGENNTFIRGYGDVRDMTRIMPEFYPGKGISSKLFVDRLNQLSVAYGWGEQMMLYAIYDQLKGPAKQWINTMPIFKSWQEFVEAFLADFPLR